MPSSLLIQTAQNHTRLALEHRVGPLGALLSEEISKSPRLYVRGAFCPGTKKGQCSHYQLLETETQLTSQVTNSTLLAIPHSTVGFDVDYIPRPEHPTFGASFSADVLSFPPPCLGQQQE